MLFDTTVIRYGVSTTFHFATIFMYSGILGQFGQLIGLAFLVTSALALLTSCTVQGPQVTAAGRVTFLGDGAIRFSGKISQSSANELEALLGEHSNGVTTLIVTSLGGEVLSGLRMGRLVRDYKLRVIAQDYCVSSCANYIISAAIRTEVRKNTIVGWHGGALQPLYTPLTASPSFFTRISQLFAANSGEAKQRAYLKQWQAEEAQFFSSVGVNQIITVLGMMPGLAEKRHAQSFTFDTRTLRQLGLNIHYEGRQHEQNEKFNRYIQRFELSEAALSEYITFHEQRKRAML